MTGSWPFGEVETKHPKKTVKKKKKVKKDKGSNEDHEWMSIDEAKEKGFIKSDL